MKKWSVWIIALVLIGSLLMMRGSVNLKDRYHFQLKEDELGITFYHESGNHVLLIQNNQASYLFLLQIENKEKLELFLERYQEYPATKIWVSNDKAGYKRDKVEVITYYKDDFITFTSDPYLKLTYQNQSLCIIEKEQTFTDCDYLYVPYQVKLEVPDEVKLIIESSPISQNTNLLYRTLELKEGYLVTLKWKDDDFDTLTLPF